MTATREHPASDVERLPRKLSPSRAADFLSCPQLFYQKSVLRLPSPVTEAMVRGTLTHAVLEDTFDLPAGDRDRTSVRKLVVPAWARITADPDPSDTRPSQAAEYRKLFPAGSPEEQRLLTDVDRLVVSWLMMERANNFDPKNLPIPGGKVIDGRELYVSSETSPSLTLHGYIDRVDRWSGSAGAEHWALSDYKTGRIAGTAKDGGLYAPATVSRIRHEAFFALRVYALLMNDCFDVLPEILRLVYVASGDRRDGILTEPVTAASVEATRVEMADVWQRIVDAAETSTWPCTHSYRCKDHADVAP